jgi:GAF domain-containing protein
MFTDADRPADPQANYRLLLDQAAALWEDGLPLWANLANQAALLKNALANTNWTGFYLWLPRRNELVVGPFQGLPACTRIPSGRGVCGTALAQGRTQVVADVHSFPGHIACDAASRSEIVVPIIGDQGVVGVIDIDSPLVARFGPLEAAALEELAGFIAKRWSPIPD